MSLDAKYYLYLVKYGKQINLYAIYYCRTLMHDKAFLDRFGETKKRN